MAVCFWFLVESDLSPVYAFTAAYIREVTHSKLSEKHGHVVWRKLRDFTGFELNIFEIGNLVLYNLSTVCGFPKMLYIF